MFYGGAAGGGKTSLLVGNSLTKQSVSIIYRPQYSQLQGLRDEILKFAPHARTNWQTNIVKTADGRQVELGAMERPGDWRKFSGRPHDFIGFDEIQLFARENYFTSLAWLRTTKEGQRCRVIATGNPPTTSDGEWVITEWAPWIDDAYANPAKPGELRWYITCDDKTEWVDGPGEYDADGRTVRARSRTFIPAKVSDNPYFSDGAYESVLSALPEAIRLKMLDGDFTVRAGSDPWQIIPTEWIEMAMDREIDYGDQDALGIDVARGGNDKTVISPRHGKHFAPLLKRRGADTPNGEAVARFVSEVCTDNAECGVDIVGIGSAAYDALLAKNRFTVIALSGGETSDEYDIATGKLGFANKITEWHWRLREALDPETGAGLSLPRDSELKADLCAARFELRGNKIHREKKDSIKKRIGRSPDCGDSVIYAWAVGDNRDYDIGYQQEADDYDGPAFYGEGAPTAF